MTNDKTKWVWTNESGSDSLPPLPDDGQGQFETRPMTSPHGLHEPDEEKRTRIYRPKSPVLEPKKSGEEKPSDFSDASGPVVGWIVVMKGPGLGTSMTLGIGANTIGRDRHQRVVLDFGDTMISRTNHATILYDDRARAFFIQHGEGKNLTRVNGNLVIGLSPLKAGDTVELGPETTVRFVPFCGAEFDWAEVV